MNLRFSLGVVGSFVSAATLLSPSSAQACAACRNPTLPVSRGQSGDLERGKARIGLSLTSTYLRVVHPAGCEDVTQCAEVPVQPAHDHDQVVVPVELRASAEVPLDSVFGLELQLPIRLVTTSVSYHRPNGDAYTPVDEGVHHRNETMAGPADPWVLLRMGSTWGGYWMAARPGFTIPIGRTSPNPYALGDQGLEHQHIQFGTGTFDPALVVEASGPAGPLQLELFAQGQASLYSASNGYRGPRKVYGGASVSYTLAPAWRVGGGLEGLYESADTWDGSVRQDGNLGRGEFLLAASASYLAGAATFSLSGRGTLWRHIVEGSEAPGKLTQPLSLSLAITKNVDFF